MKPFVVLEPYIQDSLDNWRIVSLHQISTLRNEVNVTGEVPLLSLLSSGDLVDRDANNQPPSPDYLFKYGLVQPGDLVVNPMWLNGGGIGVSNRYGAVSPEYRIYRLNKMMHPRYVHHLLRSSPYLSQYKLLIRADTTFDRRVTKEDFRELPLLVPPIQTQQSIAAYLDEETTRLDSMISKKTQMIELLEERRIAVTDSSVMKETGNARPVAALATYINGWPFKPDDFGIEGLPVVRIKQLVDPLASMDHFNGELPESVCLKDGDLVFSWSGSLKVRLWQRGPAFLNQHLYKVLPREGINKLWLRFALDTATRLFEALMHGSAMTHITQPMMKDVRLPVPTESRQREIAQRLEHSWGYIEAAKAALNRQIELLTEHRRALITAAVMGELEIPLPEAVA